MGYQQSAQWHELFMPAVWAVLKPALAQELCSVTRSGLVVDLGAGSGVGLSVLAEITDAELIAVEPHRTMRTALMARLATDNGLAARTTVVARGLPEAGCELPAAFDALIAAHLIGHLGELQQHSLWRLLSERLTPGGVALITVTPDPGCGREGTADDGEAVSEQRTIGRRTYTATHRPHPGLSAGSGYHTTYRVWDGPAGSGVLLSECVDAGEWRDTRAGDVREALAGSGLAVTSTGHPALLAVRRESPSTAGPPTAMRG